MARAHAASACVQSDSIKGLAQSIAKPAYHRLLIAEPALRRAVPTLIIAFLITICLGAFVQVVDQNRQKRAAMKRDLAAVADILAERIDHLADLRASGLTDPQIRAGGIYTETNPAAVAKLLNWKGPRSTSGHACASRSPTATAGRPATSG